MRYRTGIAVGAGLALLLALPVHADDRPLSPAQAALFDTDHLKDITKPVVLEYAFEHHGGTAGDFTDKIAEEIRTIREDGKKDVWVDFLTGDRKQPYPPALGFKGNPMLMYFLEHDVAEMQEATGGSPQYFRNRIRAAFLDGAEMHPVEVTLDGKAASGTEITVTPFRQDPNLGRFPGFADRSYHFILSPAVPGEVYRISTTMPMSDANPAPFEDTITYTGEHS